VTVPRAVRPRASLVAGHVLGSYVRCPCRADEGISGHTVVRCTTDGCRSAWYRPRHYPPSAAPTRDTGVPDPQTWLGDRTRSREHNTVGSQVGSHRQSTQYDSESNEVSITGINQASSYSGRRQPTGRASFASRFRARYGISLTCRIADVASSHIYALAWMPSAAAAMSIQTCRATGARRAPNTRPSRTELPFMDADLAFIGAIGDRLLPPSSATGYCRKRLTNETAATSRRHLTK
jgi:hypothetical protein